MIPFRRGRCRACYIQRCAAEFSACSTQRRAATRTPSGRQRGDGRARVLSQRGCSILCLSRKSCYAEWPPEGHQAWKWFQSSVYRGSLATSRSAFPRRKRRSFNPLSIEEVLLQAPSCRCTPRKLRRFQSSVYRGSLATGYSGAQYRKFQDSFNPLSIEEVLLLPATQGE